MKPIKNINTVFSTLFFTALLAGASVPAYASWENAGMQPLPHQVHMNVVPPVRVEPQRRVQLPQHEAPMNVAGPVRVEPQHRVEPPQHRVGPPQHEVPMNVAGPVRVEPQHRGQYPQRNYDRDLYKYYEERVTYIPVSPAIVVPDDLEEVVVDGQTYFYSEGVFYQQEGDQLVTIGPVVGAVVDYLPPDYQIVMADGVNYFVWGGVYYQRLAEGFEVVVPPDA